MPHSQVVSSSRLSSWRFRCRQSGSRSVHEPVEVPAMPPVLQVAELVHDDVLAALAWRADQGEVQGHAAGAAAGARPASAARRGGPGWPACPSATSSSGPRASGGDGRGPGTSRTALRGSSRTAPGRGPGTRSSSARRTRSGSAPAGTPTRKCPGEPGDCRPPGDDHLQPVELADVGEQVAGHVAGRRRQDRGEAAEALHVAPDPRGPLGQPRLDECPRPARRRADDDARLRMHLDAEGAPAPGEPDLTGHLVGPDAQQIGGAWHVPADCRDHRPATPVHAAPAGRIGAPQRRRSSPESLHALESRH